MMCLARVASPNSLHSSLLVTLSHRRPLSVGSCFDIGRMRLGTTRSGVRSIRVVHSSSPPPSPVFVFPFAAAAAAAGEDLPEEAATAEAGRHRTTLRQQPSTYPSTHAVGTCFTLVHSSCSFEDGSYRCMTPSSKKCGLPSQLWPPSFHSRLFENPWQHKN